jgi:hypothetical protein
VKEREKWYHGDVHNCLALSQAGLRFAGIVLSDGFQSKYGQSRVWKISCNRDV